MRDQWRSVEGRGRRRDLLSFVCGALVAAVGSVWAARARRGWMRRRTAQIDIRVVGEGDAAAPPMPPAFAGKADDLEALRTALVDAAGVSAGLWLSYLFVLFYLLVATGGVTHRDLLYASPVKLPFLGVDLPLEGFFWFGPALFLVVHAYVLLHFVLLADKVNAFDAQLRLQIGDADVRTRLRQQLPSNIFVQVLAGPREVRDGVVGLLLWLVALISLAVGPVVLLAFLQLQFLPYHHEAITWWQRIAVALDLWLLWTLWRRIGLREAAHAKAGEGRRRWQVAAQRVGTGLAIPLLALAALPLVFLVATFPGEWLEKTLPPIPLREALIAGGVDLTARKPRSWLSNRLVLPGLDVINHARLDSEVKITAVPVTVSLRGRRLEGAVFIGAVLGKVDLTDAQLQAASFEEARLQGATLTGARLQGASLQEAQLQGATLTGAQLQGAWLHEAQLQGAMLEEARLQGAWLTGAQLQGAQLQSAKLQGATLDRAQLQGAQLQNAQFQGARLQRAQLQGAMLYGAQFQGAVLDSAFVWRADARHIVATNTMTHSLEIEPKRQCGNTSAICDWSAEDLGRLMRFIEQTMPEGALRAGALARIASRLDPAKPLDGDSEITRHWADLQQSSPDRDAYEAELAKQWRQIGCAKEGAPFVLAALTERMAGKAHSIFVGDHSSGIRFVIKVLGTFADVHLPFEGTSRASQLAADFLKEGCVGAQELANLEKEELRGLRNPVPPTLQRPGAGAQQP